MRKGWILVALLGLGLVGAGGCTANAREKGKEEQEVKVTLDQVPAAAKATLQKEANGAQIGTVDKELKNGKAVYEADVTIGGKPYEIKVAEDGSLLNKKLEDEKEEREEKGER